MDDTELLAHLATLTDQQIAMVVSTANEYADLPTGELGEGPTLNDRLTFALEELELMP